MTAERALSTYGWEVIITALMRNEGFHCEGPSAEEYEAQIDGVDDEADNEQAA